MMYLFTQQHLYDDLMSSDPVHPPSFSRRNSPHLLITPPPYSSAAPIYHTLERQLLPSSPLSPHNRLTRYVYISTASFVIVEVNRYALSLLL